MLADRLIFNPAAQVPDGAYLFYKFDEAAASTTVENFAGATDGSRDGTVTSVAGEFDTAWNFALGPSVNTNIVTPSGAVSLSTWVKFNTLSGRQIIAADIAASGLDNSARLFFGINGANYEMIVANGSSAFYNGTSFPHGLTAGVYTNLTYTLSGTAINIYKNGVLAYSITSSVAKGGASADALRFAKGGAFAGIYLNAALDQTRLYNRELNAAEVMQLYMEAA